MSLVFISYLSTSIKISNGEEVIKKNSSVVKSLPWNKAGYETEKV